MQILKDIESIRIFVNQQKLLKRTIGLVPTMGALHDGHLSLVRQSVAENDISIASIFVNPIQFNNPADLKKYPRTPDKDIEMLAKVGCQSVFCPETQEMYHGTPKLSIDFGELEKKLEGAYRPGHFSGVGIVVSKLFNIIQPNVAYFGQKDYQQYLVISRLVRDLSFPITLVCGEIVRETSGLAMSSRNQRLTSDERERASLIFKILKDSKEKIHRSSMAEVRKIAIESLSKANIKLEYFELADRSNLNLIDEYNPSINSVLLIAAYVGEVRLIDNLFI